MDVNTDQARPALHADGADQAALAAAGARYCAASYVDMHGVPKAKMVPIAHHATMLPGSELFTGAAVDGVPQSVHDEEVMAVPDPASCTVLPWAPEVAWFASDLHCQGVPFEPCSRNILKRQLARAAGHGLRFNLGIEAEFYVLRQEPDGSLAPLSPRARLAKPCYDLARLLDNFGWLDELVTAMNGLGWDVYSFDHEDGIGQFEIDFAYADGLTMADRYVFFRLMANEVARRHGGFASFMPKPFPTVPAAARISICRSRIRQPAPTASSIAAMPADATSPRWATGSSAASCAICRRSARSWHPP